MFLFEIVFILIEINSSKNIFIFNSEIYLEIVVEGLSSLNRPLLCSNATWNLMGTVFSSRSSNGKSPRGIFINENNQIFIADRTNHSIRIWNHGDISPTKTISGLFSSPYSLFIDQLNHIYYIIEYYHQVMKYSFKELHSPHGIFLNINLDLYIADSNNHRIQLFPNGTIDGITIVSNQFLNSPTSVI